MTDLEALHLSAVEAERVVNQLRTGIPPVGFVRQFTVGRQDELTTLERDLQEGMHGRAVLVRANYGGGKTHLLNLVRDLALLQGYAVSLVSVDAKRAVRFNRPDQIFTAVARAIELPDRTDRGIAALFRAYADAESTVLDEDLRADRAELEDDGKWRQPGLTVSGPVYIGLRAMIVSEDDDTRDLVTAWLTSTNPDSIQRTRLVDELVNALFVGDPRGRYELYRETQFRREGQQPGWDALNALDSVARLSGYRGLILLFDEIEDVLHNLNNRALEADALRNLFRFFAGEFLGGAYFAVTPDFTKKCKDHLLRKGVMDFPYRRFQELPHFELSPIELDDFLKLTAQIMTAHAQAFEWEPETDVDWARMKAFLRDSWQPQNPSRIRLACQGLVEFLDGALDESA